MNSELITQWLTAIGTVGSVAIALLYKPIAKCFNKPKITLDVIQKPPCLEFSKEDASSSEKDESIIMRVRVENKGKDNARNASLFVNTYYQKCEDGKYVQQDISPIKLKENSDLTPDIIASNLLYHFNLASIHRFDEMTEDNGEKKAKVFYKLFLLGGGKDLPLGKGTFIVPITVYSSDINSHMFFVEISWTSDTFSRDKKYYSFQVLSAKQFKSIQIK